MLTGTKHGLMLRHCTIRGWSPTCIKLFHELFFVPKLQSLVYLSITKTSVRDFGQYPTYIDF